VRLSRALLVPVLVVALVFTGCGQSSSSRAADAIPSPASIALQRTSHVAVVVMENREYSDVVGSSAAPFVNALARRYALATSYATTHPSLPNYLALTAGSTFGVDSDCTDCHFQARNLVDELEAAHRSWKAYMDGMPRRCFKGATAGRYAKKHNPFIYYDDVSGNPRRCSRIVPGRELGSDLRAGRLPTFAWVTPDLCEDTHDCSVATGDRYLRRLVPALLRALGPHGVLLLTWDEGTSDAGCCGGTAAGGRIATVIAGPDVRRGARPAAAHTHYSTLRMIEELLGLPLLRGAGSPLTHSLGDAFVRRPRLAGP
jgi:phosphatidylinositol-3-phosphatase